MVALLKEARDIIQSFGIDDVKIEVWEEEESITFAAPHRLSRNFTMDFDFEDAKNIEDVLEVIEQDLGNIDYDFELSMFWGENGYHDLYERGDNPSKEDVEWQIEDEAETFMEISYRLFFRALFKNDNNK